MASLDCLIIVVVFNFEACHEGSTCGRPGW
jgi:hypothetical protein